MNSKGHTLEKKRGLLSPGGMSLKRKTALGGRKSLEELCRGFPTVSRKEGEGSARQ